MGYIRIMDQVSIDDLNRTHMQTTFGCLRWTGSTTQTHALILTAYMVVVSHFTIGQPFEPKQRSTATRIQCVWWSVYLVTKTVLYHHSTQWSLFMWSWTIKSRIGNYQTTIPFLHIQLNNYRHFKFCKTGKLKLNIVLFKA